MAPAASPGTPWSRAPSPTSEKKVTASNEHLHLSLKEADDALYQRYTEKQAIPRVDLFHEPSHVTGVPGHERAAVTVDSGHVRYRRQRFVKDVAQALAAHIDADLYRFAVTLIQMRLQWQVQHLR